MRNMVEHVEGTHKIGDLVLYTKTFKPSSTPLAKLIFLHGFNDHINRYNELFDRFASRGIEVAGFDQRGWGRSVHQNFQKGLTGTTEVVIGDIVSFISSHLPSPVPVFVMGHSMGGGEALYLACDRKYAEIVGQIRGWILESPFIAFPEGYEPTYLKIFFGRLAANLLPRIQLSSALPPENLTRDPIVMESLKTDPLLHGYGTLEGLSGMLGLTNKLRRGKVTLNKGIQGIWLGHGTQDKATSFEGSKKWFEVQCRDVEDKEFRTYDGWYHQLHADLPENSLKFADDVGDWILNRVKRELKL